jgi:deazaflavin-dependent oxidoreductase (nitroreductase family)
VVWFSPGEKHWHGATPTTAITHIAIQEKKDSKVVDWMAGQRRAIPRREIKEIWMSPKPSQNDTLKGRLSRSSEITIIVTGRKSGHTISNPVWFVLDEDKLYLLPVQGSATQWYKNVLKNPSIHIKAGGAEAEFKAIPITDPNRYRPWSRNSARSTGRAT